MRVLVYLFGREVLDVQLGWPPAIATVHPSTSIAVRDEPVEREVLRVDPSSPTGGEFSFGFVPLHEHPPLIE